jgi:hypothetical protein
MSGNAKEPMGGEFFKCTRGNCNYLMNGPHEQDAHNHSQHLATNDEVNKTYGEYSYNEVVR